MTSRPRPGSAKNRSLPHVPTSGPRGRPVPGAGPRSQALPTALEQFRAHGSCRSRKVSSSGSRQSRSRKVSSWRLTAAPDRSLRALWTSREVRIARSERRNLSGRPRSLTSSDPELTGGPPSLTSSGAGLTGAPDRSLRAMQTSRIDFFAHFERREGSREPRIAHFERPRPHGLISSLTSSGARAHGSFGSLTSSDGDLTD